MADLLTSAYSNTYDNSGTAVAGAKLGANAYKHVIATSDGGRTLIIKIALSNMTDANLSAMISAIGQAGGDGTGLDTGGPDAFSVAGFGTADGTANGQQTVHKQEVKNNMNKNKKIYKTN